MRQVQPNLLPDNLALYRLDDYGVPYRPDTFPTDWTVDAPQTLTVVDDTFYHGNRFALRISNPSAETITIRSGEVAVNPPYAKYNLIFNSTIYCTEEVSIAIYLHPHDKNYTEVSPNEQILTPGVWNAVFSNEFQFPNAVSGSRSFEITLIAQPNSNKPIWFSTPNLTDAEPDKYNQFSILTKPFFPDIFRDIDDDQQNPPRPLAKIFHSLTEHASIVMDEYVAIASYDGKEETPNSRFVPNSRDNLQGRSALTDIELMSEQYQAYMAMYAGTRLKSVISIDGETSIIPESVNFRQWQLFTKAFGLSSGTRQAMKQACKLVLTGSKSVIVSPLWEGDPWEIRIRTIASETPDADVVGESSPTILQLATMTKPAGYTVSHESIESITFVLNDADFGVFDQNVLG